MEIVINDTTLVLDKKMLIMWLILLLFAVLCLGIGYYFGIEYGIKETTTYFQNYINESCYCVEKFSSRSNVF